MTPTQHLADWQMSAEQAIPELKLPVCHILKEGVQITLCATSEDVRDALIALRQDWGHLDPAMALWPAAELVLAETMNNIVEHAMARHDQGKIGLYIKLGQSGLSCCLNDDGDPMPGGALPEAAVTGPCPDDLPEGGFGWPLVRCLTHDLSYERASGENILRFRLAWNKAATTS